MTMPKEIVYIYCHTILRMHIDECYDNQKYFDICFPRIIEDQKLCLNLIFHESYITYQMKDNTIFHSQSFSFLMNKYLLPIYNLHDSYFFTRFCKSPMIINQFILN